MTLSAERRQELRVEAEFLKAFPPEALKPDGHTFIELEAALTEAEESLRQEVAENNRLVEKIEEAEERIDRMVTDLWEVRFRG